MTDVKAKDRVPARRRGGIDREAILAAAAELFAKKSYRATSLDEIAAKLGIKKTSLYHYIESKEDILLGIYDQFYALAERHLVPVAEMDLPPHERLRRMVHAYVDAVTADANIINALIRAEFELSPESRKTVLRKNRALERLFERVLVQGQEQGTIRMVTPRLAALAIIGMIEFTVEWYTVAGWPLPVEKIAAEFVLLMESGWLADGGSRTGVWPRASSVEEAMKEALQRVERLRVDLAELSVELDRVKTRLEDGLAQQS